MHNLLLIHTYVHTKLYVPSQMSTTMDGRGSLLGWSTAPPPLHTTVPSETTANCERLVFNFVSKISRYCQVFKSDA